MRILVTGGREYHNYDALSEALYNVLPPTTDDPATWLAPDDTVIIHGGARGADTLADQWAIANHVAFEQYKPDWTDMSQPCVVKYNNSGQYNALAGFKRNQRMIDEGKPDIVLACIGGRGTADMIKRAKDAGIPVVHVEPLDEPT